ncbi:Uncharacterized protein FWK35_00022351 [Aphis craccivora]|uniref:Uncharacterized protein n=1 Tax=Aphis craccivora TaxID=307492 RepID=A0A6G0WLA8_APHCR|nr:Uncharacterized protein FWK35_00022351 [Aphis craccivora]
MQNRLGIVLMIYLNIELVATWDGIKRKLVKITIYKKDIKFQESLTILEIVNINNSLCRILCLKGLVGGYFLDSERSEECIDFTMIITSRNNAPISNYGGGFRCKSEYPWCIIEVKS